MAKPTEIRLNDIYVLVYSNIAKFLVQGVIPFISLSFLNYRIYWVMKRRRELINRPTPRPEANTNEEEPFYSGPNNLCRGSISAQRKANEAKQALVLFIIVFLFLICHTPRLIMNIHEFVNLDLLKQGVSNECETFPVWAFSFTSVSHCLMTLN